MKSETNSTEYGLKEDWDSVQSSLEQIIPVYDKTNRYISLGSDLRLRKKGISLLISELDAPNFTLLDLGSGTGTMTRLFREKSGADVVMVDPIHEMMRVALSKTHEDGLLAVYESLPFREGRIDAAMAAFSLRDARELLRALIEINKLLRIDGRFLIVDLTKPDSKAKSWFISIYWALIAPAIAFLASGRLGLKFGALSKTYKRLPTISEFFRITREAGFEVSKKEFSMMGGAAIIILRKKLTD